MNTFSAFPYLNHRNFATTASILIILDANNGLTKRSDTMVASVALPEAPQKSSVVRKFFVTDK